MDKQTSEEITLEFFKRRFPDKDIEFEKQCGYFGEWVTRLGSDNPTQFMDLESWKVWKEMSMFKGFDEVDDDRKTLKELEFGRNEREDREILRKEAVKHIKYRQERILEIKTEGLNPTFINQNEALICWIKRFFNITEEDLK